jgi:hypothetical protein
MKPFTAIAAIVIIVAIFAAMMAFTVKTEVPQTISASVISAEVTDAHTIPARFEKPIATEVPIYKLSSLDPDFDTL